ncbi:MAG: hypothetical protein OQK98_10445 [Gammaproteobacteria bacterium]|nr:hypothetical protein [Gammaproteobacteria bacterium]
MKNKLFLNAIFLLTIFTCENAMSQETTTTKQYIKVEMKDAISDISLNGVPFIKNLDTDGFITTEPVNLWLKNGKNTLAYTIHSDDENTSYSPQVNALVFTHDSTQEFPTPLKNLASISYSHSEKSKYPVTKSIEFQLNEKINTRLWDDAEKITALNQNDKNEMIEIANNLAKFVLNDTKQAINLQSYKIQEDALSEGKTIDRLIEAATKSYEWLRSQDALKIDNINSNEINFNICGDGQLVNMMRSNNEDAIIIESEEMYFDIGLYFSKIKGKWTIVR